MIARIFDFVGIGIPQIIFRSRKGSLSFVYCFITNTGSMLAREGCYRSGASTKSRPVVHVPAIVLLAYAS
jgi:hypothetical protein